MNDARSQLDQQTSTTRSQFFINFTKFCIIARNKDKIFTLTFKITKTHKKNLSEPDYE